MQRTVQKGKEERKKKTAWTKTREWVTGYFRVKIYMSDRFIMKLQMNATEHVKKENPIISGPKSSHLVDGAHYRKENVVFDSENKSTLFAELLDKKL